MSGMNRKLLLKFLKQAPSHLKGRWILIGGSLIPLLSKEIRITTDIDLAGFGPLERGQTLELIELAESLKLPVESINAAAIAYLRNVPQWQSHAVLLHQEKDLSLYRPDLSLYLILKINRLSEADLQDCLEFKKIAKSLGDRLNIKLVTAAIRKRLKDCSPEVKVRLRILQQSLKIEI